MKDIALVIFPYSRWNLTLASLYNITTLGAMVELHGMITDDVNLDATPAAESVEEQKSLLQLLKKVQPLTLYDLAGKKMFRTPAMFWEKADTTIQQYVKKISDQRLAGVIRKAAELEIPIFYRQAQRDIILTTQQLRLSGIVPLPHMTFKRTENGTEYMLTLKLDQKEIIPLEHHVNIITASPGIISVDNVLYFLDEHFSGKLFLPFRDKKVVPIPQRMERDYFRKFILRNVASAEVDVEGFELTDIHPKGRCRLSRVVDVMGGNSLVIEYIYDNKAFRPSDKASCHVTLEETDGGFRFLRVMRDMEWERSCWDCLEFCTSTACNCRLYDNCIRFDSLDVMIDWMKCYAMLLRKKGIDMEQPSDETYYIGAMDLHEDIKQSGDWLLLHSEIVLEDGRKVPFLALRDIILAGENKYTMTDGTRLIIPEVWLKKYTPFLISGSEEGSALRIHKTLYEETGSSVDVKASSLDDETSKTTLSTLEEPQKVPLPVTLKATLRPYQTKGYQWLSNHLAHGRGCCLSDDMGLGKTVQTIALLLHYKETTCRQKAKPIGMLFSEEEMRGESVSTADGIMMQYVSLILAPTSLVYNWQKELERFAPSLTVMAYTGSPEERRKKRRALSAWDVVITTYRTLVNDIRQLSPLQYGIIVFDESQAFKNHDSQIHKAVSTLQGQCRIALSGTPVENGLQELWSLFHVINPSLLGSYSVFSSHYLSAVAPTLQDIRTETLRRIISPYMLKRKKESVLTDLPDRQDELVICPMSPEQQSIYVSELSQARNSVMDEQSHQSIHVLAAIQRLRQIACHPALVDSASGPQDRSGKMDEVFMRLENLRGTGHKVLLFSEYVGFLCLISEEMLSREWKHAMLTGETQHREQVITDFQNDADCQFFLISLKAGGVGLNLTQADYVFILDPWWNLAAEEQAISRSHRIGQRNAVFVYRFVSEGTLEEQVINLQHDKQALIDKVLF